MAYAQPAGKRQKVREGRAGDVDYFHGIDAIEYNNMASTTDTACYRYYSGAERLHARAMEDWLKCSVPLTEFRCNGSDNHARPSHNRPWDDSTNTLDSHKRCIKALYEFCSKLGIKYWTAFDSDLVPFTDSWEENKSNWDEVAEYVQELTQRLHVKLLWIAPDLHSHPSVFHLGIKYWTAFDSDLVPFTDSWEENKSNWDEVAEYIQELTQRLHVKLLWIAPDLHSHPRYANGASTNNDATIFAQAATQIKKCLEMSQRLSAECFLLWPYREGYDAIFQTDVAREIKLFSKLLKITAEYKDRLNYRCQLLIMPYYSYVKNSYNGNFENLAWQPQHWRDNERVNCYMWDVTSCLYFLKNYNLDRYYKVCTPPGHHMYMANVYNMLGGVAITNQFSNSDSRNITLMMKCIVDQGTTPPGGISLKLVPRRDCDLRELISTYVKYIDALAKGLRLACNIITEQVFSKHIQQKYATYLTGFGSRLVSSDVSMEECEEYHKKNQPHNEVSGSKLEHYNMVFQRYLDTCDHI